MNHQLSEFGTIFTKEKLDNGASIFLFSRIGMPISIRVIFFAGSRFDTISGTAHFLEHMMVAGTRRFPSKNKLAEPLERIGGSFFASTSIDYLKFNISVPQKSDLDIGLTALREIIFHSTFEDKTLEMERGSIFSEIAGLEEDPHYVLNNMYYSMIFKNTILERNVIGSKDSVSKIKKEDLLLFKNNFLNSGRMAVLVSGDITMDECLPKINECLSEIKIENKFIVPEKCKLTKDKNLEQVSFKDNKHVYAKMGFTTVSMDEDEDVMLSLDLIAGVLGKGRTSRLVKELRYKNGLVYSVDAGQTNYPDAGLFSISTSFEHEKTEDVLKIIFRELKEIQKNGINNEELEFIKSATVKSAFSSFQTSWSWVNAHEDEMIFNPELSRTIDYYMNKINSLSLEKVNSAAKKYLTNDNFYLALCGTNKIYKDKFWLRK